MGGLTGNDSRSEQAAKIRQWRPVSRGYPVHIRPLVGIGCEVALLLPEPLTLALEAVEGPHNDPLEAIQRVAEAVVQAVETYRRSLV